jgi:hypothetical protein
MGLTLSGSGGIVSFGRASSIFLRASSAFRWASLTSISTPSVWLTKFAMVAGPAS